LSKEPALRYADMRKMVQALEHAIPVARKQPAPESADAGTAATLVGEISPAAVPAAASPEASASGRRSPTGPAAGAVAAPGMRPARKLPGWIRAVAGLGIVAGLGGLGAWALLSHPSTPAATPRPPTAVPSTRVPPTEPPIEVVEPPPTEAVPALTSECADPLGCVQIAPGEPVHIATMLTTSGPDADLGLDALGAVQIAIDDRSGSLLGRPIQLTNEDVACTTEGGMAAAVRLELMPDPNLVGIIGTTCSSTMTTLMAAISDAGLTVISPSNTSPALTLESGSWQPGYFRTAHSDLFQGSLAATFAREVLGVRTAATIHDGSPYGDPLQAVFASKFRELGGTITFQGRVDPGDTDLRSVLSSAAAGSPQLLYFPLFEPQGSRLVRQAEENLDLIGVVRMGADALFTDSFPESAGTAAVGMYLSAPYVSGPAYEEFLAKWGAKIGGVPPASFHAFAYDATNILLDAIERVATQTPEGGLSIGRQALRDAVAATSDYEGLTGLLDCGDRDFGELGTSHGDCATGQALAVYVINFAEVNQGKWPPNLAWAPDLLTSQ
jgi:branched-chain amino acid transport system substrate-binding protein